MPSRDERLTELGDAFRHAYRSLRSLSGRDTHLLPGELSHAQYVLLRELHERGPLASGELASAVGLSPAAVSQMLDHLDAEGQVERARSAEDRRVVLAELTADGRRSIRAQKAIWRKRWEGALEGVTAEELRVAAAVLERIGDVFDNPRPH